MESNLKLSFSKEMLRKVSKFPSIPKRPAPDAAKAGDMGPLSEYMAHLTYRRFIEPYRKRQGIGLALRRFFGLRPDEADALRASWEVLSNTNFNVEFS